MILSLIWRVFSFWLDASIYIRPETSLLIFCGFNGLLQSKSSYLLSKWATVLHCIFTLPTLQLLIKSAVTCDSGIYSTFFLQYTILLRDSSTTLSFYTCWKNGCCSLWEKIHFCVITFNDYYRLVILTYLILYGYTEYSFCQAILKHKVIKTLNLSNHKTTIGASNWIEKKGDWVIV